MAHDHSHSHNHHDDDDDDDDNHGHYHGHDAHAHAHDPHPVAGASMNRNVMSDEQREVLKRLKRAMMLCGSFLMIEVIGGYVSGSLAVLSDAAHLFADLASFGVAIAAAHLAALPATDQHTFGLKRAESLAALLSMISLALVSLYLAAEAVRRLIYSHSEVDGKLMSTVAFIGIMVNIALALVLGVENHIHLPGEHHDHDHDHGHANGHEDHDDDHDHEDNGENHHGHEHEHSHFQGHEHQHDIIGSEGLLASSSGDRYNHGHEASPLVAGQSSEMDVLLAATSANKTGNHNKKQKKPLKNVNLQAAYLHVFGDLMQSLGVLIAGLAIWYNPNWTIVDPICTLFFCAFVFYSTLAVLRNSVAVLLQEMPLDMSYQAIYNTIAAVPGVENVHDLHVWSISHGDPALAVHCRCSEEIVPDTAMRQIAAALKKMGITHVTIQIQQGGQDCITCYQNEGCDAARISFIKVKSSLPTSNEETGRNIV